MNYKKIFRSKKLRFWILSILNWIPDKPMLQLQYKIHTGRKLNLKNPTRFSEKLQLYKLNYRNPLMLRCTDKHEVRKVIEELGFGDILVPLIGVYDYVEDIKFAELPQQFVAKTSDGSGGNEIFICRDKSRIDKEVFFSTLKGWSKLPKSKKSPGREWAYHNTFPRRIIIEQLLSDSTSADLKDYKFFCFNGKVGFIYGISGRDLGNGAQIGIYTPDWKKLNVNRADEFPAVNSLPKPKNFDKMVDIAEDIAKNFPHVRVDLYNIDGQIFFGELTFYDGSGYMKFKPDSFDEEAGALFDIASFK